MEAQILEVISQVPKGAIFDTHTVISFIIKNNSDLYLKTYNGKPTELFHADIGKLINKYDGKLIEKIGDSWSQNLHSNFSPCTCWKKI